jgi:peptide/nickel transport system ATP-binding protein
VLGLVRPSGGRIIFQGRDVTVVPAEKRGSGTADLQAVFQNPNSSLSPARMIGKSILEPVNAHGPSGTVSVADLLRRVGLPADAAGRYPHEFSGGQLQRIAIARALANSPKLIVCDEPVSALDLSTQAQVLNLLTDLRAELGISYLFIGHNLAVVRHVCDEVVVLYRGRAMESGPASTVTSRPAHPYTQALVASSPVADVEQQRARRELRLRMITRGDAVDAWAAPPQAGCPFAPRCPHAAGVCQTTSPTLVTHAGLRVACHLYDPRSRHPLAHDDPAATVASTLLP